MSKVAKQQIINQQILPNLQDQVAIAIDNREQDLPSSIQEVQQEVITGGNYYQQDTDCACLGSTSVSSKIIKMHQNQKIQNPVFQPKSNPQILNIYKDVVEGSPIGSKENCTNSNGDRTQETTKNIFTNGCITPLQENMKGQNMEDILNSPKNKQQYFQYQYMLQQQQQNVFTYQKNRQNSLQKKVTLSDQLRKTVESQYCNDNKNKKQKDILSELSLEQKDKILDKQKQEDLCRVKKGGFKLSWRHEKFSIISGFIGMLFMLYVWYSVVFLSVQDYGILILFYLIYILESIYISSVKNILSQSRCGKEIVEQMNKLKNEFPKIELLAKGWNVNTKKLKNRKYCIYQSKQFDFSQQMDMSSDFHEEILEQNRMIRLSIKINTNSGDTATQTAWNIFNDSMKEKVEKAAKFTQIEEIISVGKSDQDVIVLGQRFSRYQKLLLQLYYGCSILGFSFPVRLYIYNSIADYEQIINKIIYL